MRARLRILGRRWSLPRIPLRFSRRSGDGGTGSGQIPNRDALPRADTCPARSPAPREIVRTQHLGRSTGLEEGPRAPLSHLSCPHPHRPPR